MRSNTVNVKTLSIHGACTPTQCTLNDVKEIMCSHPKMLFVYHQVPSESKTIGK